MAQFIPIAMMAFGAIMQGQEEEAAAKSMGQQYARNANLSAAVGQRQAEESRREGDILASRAQAVAAASGAGASDPSVVRHIANIEGRAEYDALSRLFEGKTDADSLVFASDEMRRRGKSAMNSGLINAGTSVLSGYSGMRGKMPAASSTSASGYGGGRVSSGGPSTFRNLGKF